MNKWLALTAALGHGLNMLFTPPERANSGWPFHVLIFFRFLSLAIGEHGGMHKRVISEHRFRMNEPFGSGTAQCELYCEVSLGGCGCCFFFHPLATFDSFWDACSFVA